MGAPSVPGPSPQSGGARPFVHLHVHSDFSFGDGACRIDELVETAARAGMPALAVTDHDGLYGAVRFYQACRKAGVKPIVGVEINVESVLAGGRAARDHGNGGRSARDPGDAGGETGATGSGAAAGRVAGRTAGGAADDGSGSGAAAGRGAAGGTEGDPADEAGNGAQNGATDAGGGAWATDTKAAARASADPAAVAAGSGAAGRAFGALRPLGAPAPSGAPRSFGVRVDRPHQGYEGPLRGQTAAPGWHLVLLAQDYEGWSNLCRIISAAHLEHPDEPPWVRLETLRRHNAHLIALSACRRGELGAAALAAVRAENEGRRAEAAAARRRARQIAEALAEAFGGGAERMAGRDGGRAGGGPISGAAAETGSSRAEGAAAGTGTGSPAARPDPARSHPGRARFFVELQHELLADSADYVRELAVLARELRLPMVATNNVHYVRPEDAALHDVLAAEAANMPLPNPLGRRNAELYFKSAAQMSRLFAAVPEAVINAGRIAARCNLDLGLGKLLFPAYPLPPGETAYSLLCKLCFEGAAERYRPVTPEVTARLEHELKVIQELGFAEYFLAVDDIVRFARDRDIPYSGRGSAGNSIVSYVLHICDSDPIAHDLLFERFLNPYRREMPDVDIDFCSERREEVIDYIYERFGQDRVAMVATVNTAHAPSAVRVVAKAFGFRPEEVNRLSRKVPWGSAEKLGEMLAERPELADHEFQSPHYRRIVHLAEKLADHPLHLGTHLGGFILSRDPLTDRVPLQWAAKGVVVAQFDKDDVETLGLVKMDILGLRMHSAIAEAVRRIRERTGVAIAPWELSKDDERVYELIRSARTVGLFQLESSGQRNLATRLQERTFEDVIAAISLFRPGPLQADMIAPFIRRRHGHEQVTVPHESMVPALRGTYGVIIYQEQVISVAAAVAGFSLAEADMLRRAMTHDRSLEEMDEIGRTFVEKAVARGVEREAAEEAFRQLRGFAAYGFNKAHAACFAILCNASAWLKAHYPAEFYCGLMNNQPMGFYSPRVVLNDARRFGLPVLPLDINASFEGFSVELIDERPLDADEARRHSCAPNLPTVGLFTPADRGTTAVASPVADPAAQNLRPADPLRDASGGRLALRTGLRYVKEMSTEAMHRIVAARGEAPHDILGRPTGEPDPDGRPYTSFADFIARSHVSIEIAGNLARVGAFDFLGTRREELLAQLPILYAGVRHSRAQGLAPAGEQGEPLRLIPDNADIPPLDFLPSWTLEERVRAELEILGLNVSVHPLHFLKTELRALGVTPFDRLPHLRHGSRIRLAGVLERAQMPWIRSGHRTLFLTLEDETELAQVVVFNDVYLEFGDILKSAVYLLVEGELQNDEEHGLAVVAKRVYDLLEVARSADGAPPARRPAKHPADDGKGTPRRNRDGAQTAGEPGAGAPAAQSGTPIPDVVETPLGGGDNVYPWDGPAPEDTRLRPPARRLTLPEVTPQTRPGRTG